MMTTWPVREEDGFTYPSDGWFHPGIDAEAIGFAVSLVSEGGGVAVDAGAHCGFWTRRLAESGYFNEVHAFEPNRLVFPYLLRNTDGLDGVHRWFLACARDSGGVVYLEDGGYNSGTTRQANGVTDAWAPAVAIDDLPLGAVLLMKIDVEGMELDVLRGALKTIELNSPVLVIETGHGGEMAVEHALRLGYQIMGRHPVCPGVDNVTLARA